MEKKETVRVEPRSPSESWFSAQGPLLLVSPGNGTENRFLEPPQASACGYRQNGLR
jgi:hypothetical protein